MTKFLEQAIAKVRERSSADQDMAAHMLLALVEDQAKPEEFDPDTRAAIQEGWEQSERGEVFSADQVAEFFRRKGA
jgi:hypothetical protein